MGWRVLVARASGENLENRYIFFTTIWLGLILRMGTLRLLGSKYLSNCVKHSSMQAKTIGIKGWKHMGKEWIPGGTGIHLNWCWRDLIWEVIYHDWRDCNDLTWGHMWLLGQFMTLPFRVKDLSIRPLLGVTMDVPQRDLDAHVLWDEDITHLPRGKDIVRSTYHLMSFLILSIFIL